ncbi:MAG: hypothetical protein D6786_02605 [Gammaproteobacteria bacterium]|nr:MAG: hypothetical protein D6786_02605 [Gammaproteobacteria bacterium]
MRSGPPRDPETTALHREMGFARREFFSRLEKLLDNQGCRIHEDGASVALGRGTVTIRVGAEGERRLSEHVRFPILPVTLVFDGVDPADKGEFLRRFDHGFMKGLG